MRASRIVSLVVGVVLGAAGALALIGGGSLLVAAGFQSGDDGFLSSREHPMTTTARALTSGRVPLEVHPGDWLPRGLLTVRIEAAPLDGKPVFVGIGPSARVDAYLAGVSRDVIADVGVPEGVTYRRLEGEAVPAPPGAESFWVASAAGPDKATLTWPVEAGDWTVAILNADGSAGLSLAVNAGVHIRGLGWVGAGLVAGGILLVMLAGGILTWTVRWSPSDRERPRPLGALSTSAAPYPAVLEGTMDPELSRWLWLVKWFLAIPHFIALAFLWVAFAILTLVAFFAILFTGRYPRAIFDFNVGVLRWSWRVGFYAFSALGTDRYPPFTLEDADYPARFDVAYPERLSRGLVVIKSWLLAIPHLIIVGVLTNGIGWHFTAIDGGSRVLETGGGIIGLLTFVAGVILLVTGRYPPGLFDVIVGLNRWVFRVAAYVALMRDEYPPFRLDLGGREPDAGALPASAGAHPAAST